MKMDEAIEIDLSTIQLDELLVSLGGVLFAGAEIQELDTKLLARLDELVVNELSLRELGMDMPTDETMH
jgi:hypothetical protein